MEGKARQTKASTLLATAALVLVALVPFALGAGAATTHVVLPGESIQDVLDNDAAPGDTILLKAGVHSEAIEVAGSLPGITITGEGNATTFLDGTGINADGIFVLADGVTVRDLTVRNFDDNGVFFLEVDGFLVEGVTATDNGPYGIYAIRSTNGAFRDSTASGHGDSGFYLGEESECFCTIERVTAFDNLIGYSGTGAGHITIRNSLWEDNSAGIVPNVLPGEPQPQIELTVVDNIVRNNNNEFWSQTEHFVGLAHVPAGLGIVVAGGSLNTIEDNVVTNHKRAGIAMAWLFTEPSLNVVRGNVVSSPADNGEPYDAVDVLWDGGGVNNCFEANTGSGPGGSLTFDAGLVWNTAGFLPDCSTPNAGAPDPVLMTRLVSLIVFGCEPYEQPGGACHFEG